MNISSGTGPEGVIHITCSRCGLAWDRDLSPRCVICGEAAEHTISEPVVEKARGSQLSIVGMTTTSMCHPCYKRDYLNREYRHIPPGQNPAEGF